MNPLRESSTNQFWETDLLATIHGLGEVAQDNDNGSNDNDKNIKFLF
jgi:hypothetical protein